MDYFQANIETKSSNKIKTVVIGILVLLCFYIGQYLGLFITYGIGFLQGGEITDNQFMVLSFTGMFIIEVITIAILIIIYRHQIYYYITKELSSPFKMIYKVLMYYFIMAFLVTVFSNLDAFLYPELIDVYGDNEDFIDQALLSFNIIMILSITITGPIVEEFYFRYIVIDKILVWMPKYLAAFVSAIFFSFIHIGIAQALDYPGQIIHLILGYMPMALAFGFAYVREKHMIYNIILHMINNSLAVLFTIAML